MISIDNAIEVFNKYGYSSITTHPYIYHSGDTIGICYTYEDQEFGILERIKVCKTLEEIDEFLRTQKWLESNGKTRHVRMILDNYESDNPKIILLRNNKIMVNGEMADIDEYDRKEQLRKGMDLVAQIVYEAGDLLLVYNELKGRQLLYLKSLLELKNLLRNKYFELQKQVDIYNNSKYKRELVLLSDTMETGINVELETSIKDRYNQYVTQMPSLEEGNAFLREVWDLLLSLELNEKYYDAIREDSAIRNEIKIVEQKIAYMLELNDDLKPLFGHDLMLAFQSINHKAKDSSALVSEETIAMQIEAVKRKYSYFDKLDSLYTSEYLREAIQDSNYANLAVKYAPGVSEEALNKVNTPLNEIAAALTVQYKEKLSIEEQSILVLYNNDKYRKLCDAILNIDEFANISVKDIVKYLRSMKGFSKLKTDCYDSVKNRIELADNSTIKASLFKGFDFSTFDSFIGSLVKNLAMLKNVNEKMLLSGDINMYFSVTNINDINNDNYVMVTSDLSGLENKLSTETDMIGIMSLTEGIPVLYSPYYFDIGDTFSKDASPLMYIKEMVNLNILIDLDDVNVSIDPKMTKVVNYQSTKEMDGNLAVISDLRMSNIVTFCKYVVDYKLKQEKANSMPLNTEETVVAPDDKKGDV